MAGSGQQLSFLIDESRRKVQQAPAASCLLSTKKPRPSRAGFFEYEKTLLGFGREYQLNTSFVTGAAIKKPRPGWARGLLVPMRYVGPSSDLLRYAYINARQPKRVPRCLPSSVRWGDTPHHFVGNILGSNQREASAQTQLVEEKSRSAPCGAFSMARPAGVAHCLTALLLRSRVL